MGNNKGEVDEKPVHEINVDAFHISKYPVTNADYERYVIDKNLAWQMPIGKDQHPAVNIKWEDARDYAIWAEMWLLTEAEREKAATWDISKINPEDYKDYKRVYPWGGEFIEGRCNSNEANEEDTTLVGKYSPQGDSPCGVVDMVGNVWEWTSTLFRNYPYEVGDSRENPVSNGGRVLRGRGLIIMTRQSHRANIATILFTLSAALTLGFCGITSNMSNLNLDKPK